MITTGKLKTYLFKKEGMIAGASLLLLLGLPVFVAVTSKQQNLNSNAAGAASIESENGTTAGNVTIVNDANASGGKYAKFGTVVACGGPISITAGGTYSGCYESTNPANPAVVINTTAPVTLDHATIRHAGEGIRAVVYSDVQLTVTNSKFQALNPGTPSDQRAMYLYKPASLIAEHNSFQDGHGIFIGGNGQTVSPIRIRYNTSLNIGHYSEPGCCIQFAQFNRVISPAAEIAWNKITNIYGQSQIEDTVNMYMSSGTGVANPIDIHNNLVDGAYPDSGDGSDFTGGGLLLGDGDVTAVGNYGIIHDNRVIGSTNYGVGVAGGHDNHLYNNRVVSDMKAENGTTVGSTFGQGVTLWDSYNRGAGSMTNSNAYNNTSGWVRPDGRANWWLPGCDPAGACTGNVAMPDPITSATEQAERDAWAAEVAGAGLTIGPNW